MRSHRAKRTASLAIEALEDRRLQAGGLTGLFLGQDLHDFAGGPSADVGNGVQDIHISLSNVPSARTIKSVDVLPYGGGEWDYGLRNYSTFSASLRRSAGSTTADIYVEPYRVETGREFHLAVVYDDGSTDSLNVAGGAADPNLRMPGTSVSAAWLGQDGTDLTSPTSGVGPDGNVDLHLSLANLDPTADVAEVTVARPSGTGWGSWLNPTVLNSAEFVRGTSDRTKGDLWLSPDSDLYGTTLTVTVTYTNAKTDQTTLAAGHTAASLAAPTPAPVSVNWNTISAAWVGQDGLNLTGPGDVHLAVSGVPAGRSVVSAVVSNQAGTAWFYAKPGSGITSPDPSARPLGLRAGADATKLDLGFAPVRDENGATLTVRLVLDDGSNLAVPLTGGSSNPGLRVAGPSATSVVAYPGDDLNDLANRFGTVRLVAGLYPMNGPLVLNKPVTIKADPGVTLIFSQKASDPTWTAAIKVNASHTALNGFAVRFTGPVRWTDGVSYGPAVVGTTDSFDPWNADPRVDLNFLNLDLQSPPASTGWEEAVRLFRLNSAESGVIANNRMKGGATELTNGPWLVSGNTYLGALPRTYAYDVFATHYSHDITVTNNSAVPAAGAGKTWRFLVQSQSGLGDSVLGNTVVGVGPMDADTVANPNAPETILSEAYRLHYEGQVASVSADGRVVQIFNPQGGPARTGDVLSVLSGTQAGQWRTVAQVINANTYVLDRPIAPGKFAVSLATGFVNQTYSGNTVDSRGSSTADAFVLVGNQFGATVSGNHILGGNYAFRITSAPTEAPTNWGWSHAPFLGGVIAGNTVNDSLRGGTFDVERSSYVRSGAGRVYFTGSFTNNTALWDDAFLAKRAVAGFATSPVFVTVGNSLSADTGELVLTMSGNSVFGPTSAVMSPTFQVVAGTINGKSSRNLGVVLPSPGITVGPVLSVTRPVTTAAPGDAPGPGAPTVSQPTPAAPAMTPPTATTPTVSLAHPTVTPVTRVVGHRGVRPSHPTATTTHKPKAAHSWVRPAVKVVARVGGRFGRGVAGR